MTQPATEVARQQRGTPAGARGDASPYDSDDTFGSALGKGFVELWGLPSRIVAARDARGSA